jgi:hypothetical protein
LVFFGAGTSRAANRHRLPLGSFGAGACGVARRHRLPLGSWLMSPKCWSASTGPFPGRVPERGCELALKGMLARPSPPSRTGPEQRPTSWGHEPGSFGTGEIEGGQSSQTTIGFVWYGDIEGGQSSQTGRLPVIHSFPRVAKEPREAVLQDTIEDGASGFLVISDHSAVSGGAEV